VPTLTYVVFWCFCGLHLDRTDSWPIPHRALCQEYSETLGYKPNLSFVKGHIEFLREVRRQWHVGAAATTAVLKSARTF